MTENPLYVQDLYARGRADQHDGTADQELWVSSGEYRAGLAAERTAQVDQELLAQAGRDPDRDAPQS